MTKTQQWSFPVLPSGYIKFLYTWRSIEMLFDFEKDEYTAPKTESFNIAQVLTLIWARDKVLLSTGFGMAIDNAEAGKFSSRWDSFDWLHLWVWWCLAWLPNYKPVGNRIVVRWWQKFARINLVFVCRVVEAPNRRMWDKTKHKSDSTPHSIRG